MRVTSDDLKRLDEKAGRIMVRACARFDEAQADLKAHGEKLRAEEAKNSGEMERLGRRIDAVLQGAPLGEEEARDILAYLKLAARQARVGAGRALARKGSVPE